MPASKSNQRQRPRELRRRVLLPARVRVGASWSDACILNISSHGVMIHAGRPFTQGSVIELRHQEHVIVGRVVWREGAKAGLRSDDRLPVEQILSLANASAFQLAVTDGKFVERRRRPRTHEQSRIRARYVEFAGIVLIGLVLSGALVSLVSEALARPLAEVSAALGGN